ncbi:hypothetical protein GOP47_0025253 [Adiantum capillus-veneris]|uniref:Uncharacterized protein n=1 Tax=Adiantum capillus-veneris TaxID=13818 RepID=A0A9D4U1V2_ADICA|nr:hypothetical protein GOP47_0025253 [Adiantum capillus-veneris]
MVSFKSATLQNNLLVHKEELDKCEKECTREHSKLKNIPVARHDNFELKIEELNGKAIIQLWCNECGEAYGIGSSDGKLVAYTCLENFLRTHIFSKIHEKMYHSKRGILKVAIKEGATTEDDASCILHALEVMKSFNNKENGMYFCLSYIVIDWGM